MRRRVLVTGARGYLGGRLVAAFADMADFETVGTTRNPATPRPQNWPSNVEMVTLDPLSQDQLGLERAVADVDTIIHLSAANEIDSAKDPVEALLSCGVATAKLVRAAQAVKCRRLIFISTIHVYGEPLAGRITEAAIPRPLHPYAIAHHAAEDYVLAAQARGAIEGVVLRLSNGIGAPAWASVDRWTLVGNNLCRQAVEHGKLTLTSSGQQWRDFIMLSDFVRALRHMVVVTKDTLGDGLFNLGGRLPLRIIDLAQLISERAAGMLGHPVPIAHAAPEPAAKWQGLDYAIDRIVATGFAPSHASALTGEIDATLALCRASLEPV